MTAEKKKRNRTPAVKRDGVITALIGNLPGAGQSFTRAQRVNWLRMMAMAMDGAYGVEPTVSIDGDQAANSSTSPKGAIMHTSQPAPAPAPPLHVEADADEIRFYVDAKGYARMDPGGKRIDPFDIPSGSDIEDEREGEDELDTIHWKSGQFPPAAYPERSFNILKVKA